MPTIDPITEYILLTEAGSSNPACQKLHAMANKYGAMADKTKGTKHDCTTYKWQRFRKMAVVCEAKYKITLLQMELKKDPAKKADIMQKIKEYQAEIADAQKEIKHQDSYWSSEVKSAC